MMKLATLLLASLGSWVEGLPRGKKTLFAAISLAGIGWAAGLMTQVTVGEFASHEDRIVSLEDWRLAHLDTVVTPGVATIRTNEERIDGLRADVSEIRQMVFRLYCFEFPDECQGQPTGAGNE